MSKRSKKEKWIIKLSEWRWKKSLWRIWSKAESKKRCCCKKTEERNQLLERNWWTWGRSLSAHSWKSQSEKCRAENRTCSDTNFTSGRICSSWKCSWTGERKCYKSILRTESVKNIFSSPQGRGKSRKGQTALLAKENHFDAKRQRLYWATLARQGWKQIRMRIYYRKGDGRDGWNNDSIIIAGSYSRMARPATDYIGKCRCWIEFKKWVLVGDMIHRCG